MMSVMMNSMDESVGGGGGDLHGHRHRLQPCSLCRVPGGGFLVEVVERPDS